MDNKILQRKNKIKFLNIEINNISKGDFINLIIDFGKNSARPKKIFYINAHSINTAIRNKEYRNALLQADLLFADGISVVWASRIISSALKDRINITELLDRICNNFIKYNLSVYLFGADQQTIEKAVKNLNYKYPELNIAGIHQGYCSPKEEDEVINEINRLKPNFLLVGRGVPKQEIWLHNNLSKLKVNACLAVGGLFDVLSGKLTQAPSVIRNCGLEWLYISIQEPRKLLRRYLIGNIIFVFIIMKELLFKVFLAGKNKKEFPVG